jgi:hypothetical protein
LGNEIKLFKNEKSNTDFDFEKKLKNHGKIFFKTCLASDVKADPNKGPNIAVTTDGKFLYIHNELEGLLKIGTGYGNTMFGKVYKHFPSYRLKERSSLAYIHGKLYYRSSKIAPAVLI